VRYRDDLQGKEVAEPKCSRCIRSISSNDTISFDDSQIVHLDCRRPFELNYEERALLFMFCWGHPVAACVSCSQSFRQHELAADLFDHRTHLCPRCRTDLTVSIREHLFACALVPTEVRWRAEDARDAARRLIKHRHQLSSKADILKHEAESAICALREAMKRVTWCV
jgi:hypothetical protein